ncbi:MAG: HAD family hydrolase [Lachnospiraceae bacterium]
MKLNRKPVFFLDRDGVVSEEKGYVTTLEEFKIFPYTKKCIEKMHEKGYLAIVITNQAAVQKGILSESELLKMHEKLIIETGVDGIYYCPHREEEHCNCRKPAVGLLEKAVKNWDIDLEHSYMIGDRATDILLGEKMNLKTILLESGYGTKRLEQEVIPDKVYRDLLEAVEKLVI